ncbi:hypothetical protein [Rosenbergiella nectarea]|uniref:hypothetical protein n=1 Tax=Rosenbergiella nectarea TaxID=988801 RepID=UPI001F4E1372|nr:hypothetical protein [Rosenbergiella nectarea]
MEKMKNNSPEASEKKELMGCVLSCKKELWSIGFFSVIINIFFAGAFGLYAPSV